MRRISKIVKGAVFAAVIGTCIAGATISAQAAEGDMAIATSTDAQADGDADLDENVSASQITTEPDGWVQIDGRWYYRQNGEFINDTWLKYNGYWYYFRNEKMLQNGFYSIKDEKTGKYQYYHFDENGRVSIGWYLDDGRWAYSDKAGVACSSGIYTIGGKEYYFQSERLQTNCKVLINNTYYYFGLNGELVEKLTLQDGWNKFRGQWYYKKTTGTLAQLEEITDTTGTYYFDGSCIMVRDGKYNGKYYDADGRMVTGWCKDHEGGWNYYYKGGKAADGIVSIKNKTYYFADGHMYKNKVYIGSTGMTYFGDDGYATDTITLKKGWNKFRGNWYYCLDTGELVCNTTFKAPDGYTYYFNDQCAMVTEGKALIAEGKYGYFDDNGHMIKGWYKNINGIYFYAYADGSLADGLCTINGKLYYFENNELVVLKTFNADGKCYAADKNGNVTAVATNKWIDNMYYVANGKLATGWKKIDGAWYYFAADGKMVKHKVQIDGNYYYFDSLGRMMTGWFLDSSQKWCYANKEGVLITDGWQTIGGKNYYFKDGNACTGLTFVDNQYAIFDDDCVFVKYVIGSSRWVKVGRDYYYIDASGNKVVKTKYVIDGDAYYFDNEGIMRTSYMYYDDYFGKDGRLVKNQWVSTSSGIYYYGKSGRYRNTWAYIDGKWYYFNYNGYMQKGIQSIDGGIYDLGEDGAWNEKNKVVNGWVFSNGLYYYYENGIPAEGIKTINKDSYHFVNGQMYYDELYRTTEGIFVFGKDGKLIKNGWYKKYGRYVYTDANGCALVGLQTINGKQYYFMLSEGGYISYFGIGMMVTDFVSDDGKYCYEVGSNGVVKTIHTAKGTGWLKLSSGNYAYCLDGRFVKGYQVIGGKAYYFIGGIMTTNEEVSNYGYFGSTGELECSNGWADTTLGWMYLVDGSYELGAKAINGKDYYLTYEDYGDDYLDRRFYCLTGVEYVDGQLYDYNEQTGSRKAVYFKDGWTKYNGKWYYKTNGKLANGCVVIDGETYLFTYGELETDAITWWNVDRIYLGSDGKIVKSKWVKYYGYDYYVDANGRVVKGVQTINGVKYLFSMYGEYIGRL